MISGPFMKYIHVNNFIIVGLSPVSNSGVTPYKEKSEDEVDDNQDNDFNSFLILQSPYTPMINRGGGRGGAQISTNDDAKIEINKNSNSDPESCDSSSSDTEKHSLDELHNEKSVVIQSSDRNNEIYGDELSCSDESTELKKQSMLVSPSITLRHSHDGSDSDDSSDDDSISEGSKKKKANNDVDDTDTAYSNRKLSFQKIKNSKSSSPNLSKKATSLPGPLCDSTFREARDPVSDFDSDRDSDNGSQDGNVSNASGLQFMSLLCVDEVSPLQVK